MGGCWWHFGGLLVAFWGFLGGIPFCNALKVNALRAQKNFICFICVYKNIYRGLFANANPHIFLCFLIPVRRKKQGLRRSAYSLRQ